VGFKKLEIKGKLFFLLWLIFFRKKICSGSGETLFQNDRICGNQDMNSASRDSDSPQVNSMTSSRVNF